VETIGLDKLPHDVVDILKRQTHGNSLLVFTQRQYVLISQRRNMSSSDSATVPRTVRVPITFMVIAPLNAEKVPLTARPATIKMIVVKTMRSQKMRLYGPIR
jgi:hypothetical protein